MKTRTDLLNHLAEKYNLQIYLELGTQVRAINFEKIICKRKFCVDIDPKAKADYTGSTDDFFKMLPTGEDSTGSYLGIPVFYDLIFIDASHHAEDVQRDFKNALRYLNSNGFIVLHDCNPEKEVHTIVPRPTQTGHWNGDVVRFAIQIKPYGYTVDIDNGCFIYHNTTENINSILYEVDGSKYLNKLRLGFSWNDFDKNRKEHLNLITWDEFISLNPHI